jgi:putative hydrolase of the HAD superfamily
MVLVFDLDDTLYDELTYVASGFRAVAFFLEERQGWPTKDSYAYLQQRLDAGRGHIFDDCLRHFGGYSRKSVRDCLSIYRKHQPDIKLYPDAADCLRRFSCHPIYIVTDGNKIVQQKKLEALGLYRRVSCYITHRFGLINEKPSTYCFQHICRREKVSPAEIAYFGDNPRKDFVGIKPVGFRTVRLLRGQHKDVVMSSEYEADYQIETFDELNAALLGQIFSGRNS